MTLLEIKQSRNYRTDKTAYLRAYERFFAPLREHRLVLLEMGVYKGESLMLWRDYFPCAIIVGFDKDLSLAMPRADGLGPRIRLYQGDQVDQERLKGICRIETDGGFDIVIDDAGHLAHEACRSFEALFENCLKPGGMYAIEDWGVGYWPSWPDSYLPRPVEPTARFKAEGKDFVSHQAGMVGWLKQLIDECGLARSPIESLHIQPGLAILRKAL